MKKEDILLVEKKQAISSYNRANQETKKVLEKLLGKEYFEKCEQEKKRYNKRNKIFDYKIIKSFEDACRRLKIKPMTPMLGNSKFAKSVNAFYKLSIIIKAMNNGWVADFKSQDKKYWVVMYNGDAFGYSTYYSDSVNSQTSVSSNLCLKNKEMCNYMIDNEEFLELYKQYYYEYTNN